MRSSQYATPLRTLIRGEGYQELRPRVLYERYGPPDMDVYKPLRGPQHGVRALGVVEDPRRGFNDVRGGSRGPWSKSADRAVARRTIFCRNVRQNTDRSARTVGNTAISKDFVRAVLSRVSTASESLPCVTASTDRVSPT